MMINLLDYGELINYTEYTYNKEDNSLKSIKYEDINDEIRVVCYVDNGKFINNIFLPTTHLDPIVVNTSRFDYNHIKILADSKTNIPKIFSNKDNNKEPINVVINKNITLKVPCYCEAVQTGNLTTICNSIKADSRQDKYITENENVYFKLEQSDECIGAILKFYNDIEARKTNNASFIVREIPYLYDIYGAIYLSNSNTNTLESLFIETDEYGIPKDYINDPNHIGAYRMRHINSISSHKGILYTRDSNNIKAIHPLFVDPVDITKTCGSGYYVFEYLSPRDKYRRVTVRIDDIYSTMQLKKDMESKNAIIESIIL